MKPVLNANCTGNGGTKTAVLFVCHGNICRSPMAEFILKHLVQQRGIPEAFFIESAATSSEEINWNGTGNPVHPGTRNKLAEQGYDIAACGATRKRARQMTRADYAAFDLLLGMDSLNIRAMLQITGGDPEHKIRRLLDYTGKPRDIADPWYSGNFDATYDDILEGCTALLDCIGTRL